MVEHPNRFGASESDEEETKQQTPIKMKLGGSLHSQRMNAQNLFDRLESYIDEVSSTKNIDSELYSSEEEDKKLSNRVQGMIKHD